MITLSATEAKNRFGELLESSLKSPVRIAKQGREVAVMLSLEEFQQLQALAKAQEQVPTTDGLLNWIEAHPACSQPLDEQDYLEHLQEKYA